MKVYRIGRGQYIHDISGTGSSMYGGRWNSRGKFILYTAGSSALALLESVVHMNKVAAENYFLLCLEIPDTNIIEYSTDMLPENWQQNPPPDNLKQYGDNFIEKNEFLILKLPSVIMPLESNYLLNPQHPDFRKVKKLFIEQLPIDSRLL